MKQRIILFLCVTFIFSSCVKKASNTSGWTDTLTVDVLVVNDGTTPTERNYVGDIGSENEMLLSFPLGGTLTKVAISNGQHVAKGQLLAEVDGTTASSMHASALATLRQAEDAYQRLEAVHREGGISDVKWMEMETNLEKARQAEVSARKHKEDCSIRAPFSGTVSCADRHVGQDMKPGETFGRLIDMNRLRVDFSVPEQEISLIRVGDDVTAIVSALNDRVLKLRVSDKSLVANPMGHTYQVHASIVEGDRKGLLPDMVAKVKARLDHTNGITIPTECIQTMPSGTIVWVIRDGRAQHRNITVTDFVRGGVIVSDGLASGDTVITAGYQKLYTGAKVKVRQ